MEGITDSMDMSSSKLWETVKDREAQHVVGLELDVNERLAFSNFPIRRF